MDRSVTLLIKKTCHQLMQDHCNSKKDQLNEDGNSVEDDEDFIPDEFEEIIGKRLIFRIEVSEYNIRNEYPFFTVVKVSDDEDIINRFIQVYKIEQETVTTGQLISANSDGADNTDEGPPSVNRKTSKDAVSTTAQKDVHDEITKDTASSPQSKKLKTSDVVEAPSAKSSNYKARKRINNKN